MRYNCKVKRQGVTYYQIKHKDAWTWFGTMYIFSTVQNAIKHKEAGQVRYDKTS